MLGQVEPLNNVGESPGAIIARMMTTVEVAESLGVHPRNVYRAIKRSGMRWTLRRGTSGYEFSNDDVIALARVMKARNLGHLVRTLTPNACAHDASHAT